MRSSCSTPDGVNEALSPGGEAFGLERLKRCLETTPGGATSLGTAIQAALQEHTAGRDQYDDITLLLLLGGFDRGSLHRAAVDEHIDHLARIEQERRAFVGFNPKNNLDYPDVDHFGGWKPRVDSLGTGQGFDAHQDKFLEQTGLATDEANSAAFRSEPVRVALVYLGTHM